MIYKSKDIEKLLSKHLAGSINDGERGILEDWVSASDSNRALFQKLCSGNNFSSKYKAYSDINAEKAWLRFKQKHVRHSQTAIVARYAATLLIPILMIAGIWHYYQPVNKEIKKAEIAENILPGIPQATLTLPGNHQKKLTGSSANAINVNGSTVAVVNKGTLIYPTSASQQSISANKEEESQEEQNVSATDEKNILETKEGNEFWVKLEDGTVIHLNYNTELKYPVKFGSHDRTVYLRGEAYFKIAKDSRPFYVVTEEGSIKQYGTEFNVNTFTAGQTEVVLTRGKISISKKGKNSETLLRPGQLANMKKECGNVEIRNIDPASYVGWNYGRFIFDNATLESIMQTLKNWYGIEVYFEQESLKNLHFTGNMDRYGTISPILQAIAQTTNLQVAIKERKITISSFN